MKSFYIFRDELQKIGICLLFRKIFGQKRPFFVQQRPALYVDKVHESRGICTD